MSRPSPPAPPPLPPPPRSCPARSSSCAPSLPGHCWPGLGPGAAFQGVSSPLLFSPSAGAFTPRAENPERALVLCSFSGHTEGPGCWLGTSGGEAPFEHLELGPGASPGGSGITSGPAGTGPREGQRWLPPGSGLVLPVAAPGRCPLSTRDPQQSRRVSVEPAREFLLPLFLFFVGSLSFPSFLSLSGRTCSMWTFLGQRGSQSQLRPKAQLPDPSTPCDGPGIEHAAT